MKKLIANFQDRSYPIYYGESILKNLGKIMKEKKLGQKCLIVTHQEIKKKYGKVIEATLKENNFVLIWKTIPSGEENKTLETVNKIYKFCAKHQLNKDSNIISFGGGVIQDICNYISATYLRGINFIQVPTSLLSQVDVGLGGCAIDHSEGKSLIGTFYQPKIVLSDISLIKSLPEKEVRNGLAEIINKVICLSGESPSKIRKDLQKIQKKDVKTAMMYVIKANKIKLKIIEKDETGSKETRQVLDWGHTITYALEKILNYQISHGEALGIGMVCAAKLSKTKANLSRKKVEELKELIKIAGLPTELPKEINQNKLIDLMRLDQKVKDNQINFVLLKDFGETTIQATTEKEIKKALI